jgi:hypothetical protein
MRVVRPENLKLFINLTFFDEGFNLVVVAFSWAHCDIPSEDGMAIPTGEYTDARVPQMPE